MSNEFQGAAVAVARREIHLPFERRGVLPSDLGTTVGRPAIHPVDEGALVVWPGRLALWNGDLTVERWSTAVEEVSRFAVTESHVWYPEIYKRSAGRVRAFSRATGGQDAEVEVSCRGGLIGAVTNPLLMIVADPTGPGVFACDLGTGRVRWSVPFSARSAVEMGSRVIVTSVKLDIALCLDAISGREVWRFVPPLTHEYSRLAPTQGVTVLPGDVVIFAMDDGPLFRCDAADGRVIAKRDVQGRPGAMHVTDSEVIYCWLDGLKAVDHARMEESWRVTFPPDVAGMYGRKPPSVCGVHVGTSAAIWTTEHGAVMAAGWDGAGHVSAWSDNMDGAVFPLGEGPLVNAGYVYLTPAGRAMGGYCYRSAGMPRS